MRLGVLTIGQSPRTDAVPEMAAFWPDVEVVEAGALDGLSKDEVRRLAPAAGDYVLITRMGDGTEVTIAKRHILGRLQEHITGLAASGCGAILLLCTGEFPDFRSAVPLIRPQRILQGAVEGMARGIHLGLMLPSADQLAQAGRRWAGVAERVTAVSASPYAQGPSIAAAASELGEAGAGLIVMDCMGYTRAMRSQVREVTGKPVMLARSVVARVVGEIVE